MTRSARRCLVLFLILALGLGGCGAMEPYVYKAEEFNRNAPTFRKEPADRDRVTICFSGLVGSKAEVEPMAAAACEKYGKVARNRRDGIGVCPLVTPWAAHFDCVAGAPGG